MKKTLLAVFAVAALAGITSSSAFAAASSMTVNGGTIRFVGSVTDAPCVISMALKDHVVIMKQVKTSHLDTAGQASGQPTAFTVDLEDCDTSTYTNASITFNGTPDADVATAMKNEATSGAATNVALQLYGPDGAVLNLGDASSAYTLIDGTNKIPFTVDYIATAAAATAGAVQGTSTLQITYS
ncbi:fimbrial protein [Buttiauxella sp. B2]|uniref:fimbrial protein n=1 Tax=Buttiauxella sp. B2 TaxID=2587812 RepID=UPI00111F683C|nr:fimbrial protein [Buttiauxella sp. B2]TNV20488.1 fimbrial protein [Buttiauxella sp. B2]